MSIDEKVSLAYCSAGCSRSSHALSAAPTLNDEDAFVAYASSNFVSVIGRSPGHKADDSDAFSIVATPSLRNLNTEVSSVFWFTSNVILFGASDGTLCIYSRNRQHLFSSKFHAEAITSVHASAFPGGDAQRFLVASCSAEGLVRVSLGVVGSDGTTSLDSSVFQDVKCGSRSLPLETNLTTLSFCQSHLLSVGYDDGSVRLFISPLGNLKFQQAIQLFGHTDWVTSISSRPSSDGTMMFLASGSQDSTVRLWKIYTASDKKEVDSKENISSALRMGLENSSTNFTCPWSPSVVVYIRLETILKGHTDWVYTVDICFDKNLSLMNILTCSIDRSVIVWQEPSDKIGEGIWTESARFARIGGTGSAAGMSYCGASFAHNGEIVVAHSFTGALHAWRRIGSSWISIPMPSGHLGAVADLSWEPTCGQYFLTVGLDQTTRLHSSWHKSPTLPPVWFEFGRPQVHGFCFNAVAATSSTSFISAADEKAMRVFAMPRLVRDLLERLCKFEAKDDQSSSQTEEVLGATVPPLGLTNRPYGADDTPGGPDGNNATDDLGDGEDDGEGGGKRRPKVNGEASGFERPITNVTVVHEAQPPTPEILVQHTLWPEMRKLYGHGSEVYALDVSPISTSYERLIASSCKAASADNAQIILWAPWSPSSKNKSDTDKEKSFEWHPVQHLDGPTLTVTQLQFSHSGEFLLASCRDRTWHLYRRVASDESGQSSGQPVVMKRVTSLDKSTSPHARIIWTCDWSHDDQLFATGSRDQQILIWHLESIVSSSVSGSKLNYTAAISSLPSAVTALAFVPISASKRGENMRYVLAAGFESGDINLYEVLLNGRAGQSQAKEIYKFPTAICPSKSISRLRFRKSQIPLSNNLTDVCLASSSADWSCRLYNIPKDILL